MQTARFVAFSLSFSAIFGTCFGQAQPSAANADSIRVTMSLNNDGSRTVYETDTANRKATATTTNAAGKIEAKIRYKLDEAGRFETGEVYGPDDKMRFKTAYKYEPSGRLKEESQLTTAGAVRHRIVYAYDASGKPAGYSVYDAAGRLLGQTTDKRGAPPAQPATKQRPR